MKSTTVYWLNKKLYLNITNRCSNRCYFCIRNFTDGIAGFKLRLQQEPEPKKVIQELSNIINRKYWMEVVFCGFGEPTANLDCLIKVAEWINKYHFLPMRVDTNGHGYLLNPNREVAKELREAGISSVSVSLNAPNMEVYNKICRPIFKEAFKETLSFIKKAKRMFKVEITAVRVPELNVEEMKMLAEKLKVRLRLRDYIRFPW